MSLLFNWITPREMGSHSDHKITSSYVLSVICNTLQYCIGAGVLYLVLNTSAAEQCDEVRFTIFLMACETNPIFANRRRKFDK